MGPEGSGASAACLEVTEVSRSYLIVQRGEPALCLLEDLARVHGAEGVSWEVSECSCAPVDILQTQRDGGNQPN